MSEQNYANHTKIDTAFHKIGFPLLVLTWIGSGVNLYKSFSQPIIHYSAALIFTLTTAVLLTFFLARIFALKAQDRAIRAEENLRHFVLTQKLLDRRLSVKQIVALRFASDDEFAALAALAAEKNLDPKTIKQAIQNWRADDDRV